MMRVAMDIRWAENDTGGLRRYAQKLASSLEKFSQDIRLALIHRFQKTPENWDSAFHGDWIYLPHYPLSLLGEMRLRRSLISHKVHLYHAIASPSWLLGLPCPSVMTVQDLIPYLHPEWFPKSLKTRFYPLYRISMKGSIRRARVLIVPSQFVSGEIQKEGLATQDKIHVVHHGIESSEDALQNEGSRRFRPQKEILFVGRGDAHKNLAVLIRAFEGLQERMKDIVLNVAGKMDSRYPLPESKSGGIRFLGVVTDEEIHHLYQRAWVLVLPSRSEGFGFPVLEAMSHGCPVVAARAGALPEVAGEAALWVEPEDVSGLAHALEKILTDFPLRQSLIQKGIQRACQLTWEKAAQKTVAAYAQALQ